MKLKPTQLLMAMIAVVAAPVVFAQNVATVNGKAIPAARVEQILAQAMAQSQAQGQPKESPDELRKQIKENLIMSEVMLQEAEKQGIPLRADVKASLDLVRQNVLVGALQADFLKKNPVTDAEIKALYDAEKARLAAAGQKEYHARHILVEKEDDAKGIITKLKGGAKFDELAKVSKDSSANNGGDLGWSPAEKYVPEFAAAMVALQAGQVTETPVKTQFGYHVIKLDEAPRAVQLPPLQDVKAQITQILQRQKFGAFVAQLKKKAKIQ